LCTVSPTCTVGVGGDDKIDGGNDADFLVGDIGVDELIGGNDDDILFGGLDADDLFGGNGDDQLFGGVGGDTMFGENGDDFLYGGEGNDDLSGGEGVDFLDGGENADGSADADVCRVDPSEDTWIHCETVINEESGKPIGGALSEVVSTETPLQAVENVSADLESIITDNPETSFADKLEVANEKVESALDELSKIPPNNQDAVSLIESGIGEIEAAVSEGLDENTGNGLMDELAGVAKQIAQDTIDQGITGACDGGIINDAEIALSEGDSLRAEYSFKDAASKYNNSLSKAEGCF